jgi:uncharacterized protein YndB with AHSA1/START domain
MKGDLEVHVSITINAPVDIVWKALTDPSLIKKYLMGTTVVTDWQEGHPIVYSGSYQGQTYSDKGVVKKVIPQKLLQTTYWSSMAGKEDKPENYNLVTYELSEKESETTVTLRQNNVMNEKEKQHLAENWTVVLQKMKEVCER